MIRLIRMTYRFLRKLCIHCGKKPCDCRPMMFHSGYYFGGG